MGGGRGSGDRGAKSSQRHAQRSVWVKDRICAWMYRQSKLRRYIIGIAEMVLSMGLRVKRD